MTSGERVLLMTVGTGDVFNEEATLLRPLELSIRQGEWDRVILLPSAVTQPAAESLRERLAGKSIELRPLPRPGAENDADACFLHYEGVLAGLVEEGARADGITIYFTRGTKAMSAALVLAAVARGIPRLRYITGERDQRGMVKPGTETISDLNALGATTRRDLRRAAEFLELGHFAAAVRLFPSREDPQFLLYPESLRPEIEAAVWLGRFWGAWDRFDYREAWELAGARPGVEVREWSRFFPDARQLDFLRGLAAGLRVDGGQRGAAVRDLAADMLENTRRRLRQREEEDALIRAYRILELIGQARLFDRGLDSEALDTSRAEVAEWLRYKERKGRPVAPDEKGRIKLPRQLVASLLKHCKDPMGGKLLAMEKREFALLQVTNRNYSLLIHGFESQAAGKAQEFGGVLDELEGLLREDDAASAERIENVRFRFLRVAGQAGCSGDRA